LMRAYIYLRKRSRGKWPKAHWFFDDNPKARRVMAACGFTATRTDMDRPTASYYINGRAIKTGWCQKCRRWMDKNDQAILTHERLTEGS